MASEKFNEAMTKARIAFMRKKESVFMTTVCFMLKMRIDNSFPTAATDGEWLIFNEDFFLSLSHEEQVTLLGHETMHVVLQHVLRGKDFDDHRKFNCAADYVINLMLVDAGFLPIKGWLLDNKYKGMTTEEVYHLLEDMPPLPMSDILSPGQGTPGGAGADSELTGGMTAGEFAAAAARNITSILATAAAAATAAGQPGSIPREVRVFLDNLLTPKLPMQHHLRKFFQALAKTDYTYQKFNRRFGRKMILPGLAGKKMSELDFAFDMSGSVSDKDTLRYVSELMGVIRGMQPDKLNLIQFDTDIKSVDKISSVGDLSRVKLIGRGGTNIEPLMQLTKKRKPTALIVFTDGCYAHPTTNPGVPVLWMIHGGYKEQFHCNFGTTITFDV